MTIQKIFKEGIELRDKGQLELAIAQFLSIIEKYPKDSKIATVYSVLAGIYTDLDNYGMAKIYFERATKMKPKSELASLGLYVSLAELGKDEEAIMELKRFLDENSADLYKDTLMELMEGLEEGYMTSYKDLILLFAKKNGLL